jgi:MFS family permease
MTTRGRKHATSMTPHDRRNDAGPSLRDIAPAAFVPPALFAVGQGAIAPVVVISATSLGASPAVAALVVATAGLGQIVADVPAGAVVHRYGERPTMIAAAGLTVLALLGCMFAPNLFTFAAAIFLTGVGTAVWLLARQAYVTAVIPFRLRARAMSTLGGVYRIGLFIGPFVGGAVVAVTGLWGAYAVHILAAIIAAAVLASVKDLSEKPENRPDAPSTAALATVIREQRSVLSTLGVGVLVVSAVRATRQVAIPLWGQHLGLSPATISVIFGISGAVDMLLFYPAGKIMDHFGRTWIAVPSDERSVAGDGDRDRRGRTDRIRAAFPRRIRSDAGTGHPGPAAVAGNPARSQGRRGHRDGTRRLRVPAAHRHRYHRRP